MENSNIDQGPSMEISTLVPGGHSSVVLGLVRNYSWPIVSVGIATQQHLNSPTEFGEGFLAFCKMWTESWACTMKCTFQVSVFANQILTYKVVEMKLWGNPQLSGRIEILFSVWCLFIFISNIGFSKNPHISQSKAVCWYSSRLYQKMSVQKRVYSYSATVFLWCFTRWR